MRKTIKGLIIRGLTAAAIGFVAEVVSTVKKPTVAKGAQPDPVPDAEEWVRAVTFRAAQWAHDAEVSDSVREMCRKIMNSSAVGRSEAAASKVIDVFGTKARQTFKRD